MLQDITALESEPQPLTTEELEQSVRLSEFRLQTNLAALAKMQNKEDHVKEWLKSTNESASAGMQTPSECPLSPQTDIVGSFSESSGPCSPTPNKRKMNGRKHEVHRSTHT